MSARLQTETVSWEQGERLASERPLKLASETELESLFRNFDQKDLVAPLREIHKAQAEMAGSPEGSEVRRRAALQLQQHWEELLVQRELLRSEIKRGKEILEQLQRDLGKLRSRLDDWPGFERVCGKNPLLDYMQAIAAHEKVEQFLPAWLNRREAQLANLIVNLEETARETGLEHLL